MARYVLLIAGSTLLPSCVEAMAAWLSAGGEGVLVLEAEDPTARVVFAPLDPAGGPLSTEGGDSVVVLDGLGVDADLSNALSAARLLDAAGDLRGSLSFVEQLRRVRGVP